MAVVFSNDAQERVGLGKLTVEMIGATNIVARDDSDEGRRSVRASRLYTTKRIGLDCGGRTITITPSLHTSVDTSRVAAPKFNISICHRLASCHVDYVDVEVGNSTLLASEDVLTDQLATDPYDTLAILTMLLRVCTYSTVLHRPQDRACRLPRSHNSLRPQQDHVERSHALLQSQLQRGAHGAEPRASGVVLGPIRSRRDHACILVRSDGWDGQDGLVFSKSLG
jgi:hypothetical protein